MLARVARSSLAVACLVMLAALQAAALLASGWVAVPVGNPTVMHQGAHMHHRPQAAPGPPALAQTQNPQAAVLPQPAPPAALKGQALALPIVEAQADLPVEAPQKLGLGVLK